MKQVSEMYILGVKEGREVLDKHGLTLSIEERLANLNSTIKGFAASSPVGQMLRGERDFWKHQLSDVMKGKKMNSQTITTISQHRLTEGTVIKIVQLEDRKWRRFWFWVTLRPRPFREVPHIVCSVTGQNSFTI